MNKRPAHLSWVFLFFLCMVLACKNDSNPKVIENHLTEHPDIRKKYIYQSVLRLANMKDDPDFDKLIRDVRKISIYMPPREDSTYQITPLRGQLREGGYEELIDVRTNNAERISLWVNESADKPHYVGLLDSSGEDYIFEIDGSINLQYLPSLNMADEGTLRGLLN